MATAPPARRALPTASVQIGRRRRREVDCDGEIRCRSVDACGRRIDHHAEIPRVRTGCEGRAGASDRNDGHGEEEQRRGENEPPSNATRSMVAGEWIQFGMAEKRSVERLPAPEPLS